MLDDALHRDRRRTKPSHHRAGRVAGQNHFGGPPFGECVDHRGEAAGQFVGSHPAVGGGAGVRPIQHRQPGCGVVEGLYQPEATDAPVDYP